MKAKLTTLFITLLCLAFILLYGKLVVSAIQGDAAPPVWKGVAVVATLAALGAMGYTGYGRMKELDKEDEDDYRQY